MVGTLTTMCVCAYTYGHVRTGDGCVVYMYTGPLGSECDSSPGAVTWSVSLGLFPTLAEVQLPSLPGRVRMTDYLGS